MRSSVNLVEFLFAVLLLFTCKNSEVVPVSSSFLYLYGKNVILTDSTFNTCFDGNSMSGKTPFFIPNAHYCVTQELVDSIQRRNPSVISEVKPSDSLSNVLVSCIPIDTAISWCSTTYSLSNSSRGGQSMVDSILTDENQIFWFLRLPGITEKISNPKQIEADAKYYSTYTYKFTNSLRVDTLFTDLNIFLRACDGC